MTQLLMMSAAGELAISRVPYAQKETLQAFDQADLLVLNHLHKEGLLHATCRVQQTLFVQVI